MKTCKVLGCALPATTRGMCDSHYRHSRSCRFEGCGRRVRGNGLCDTHYRQEAAGKPLTAIQKRVAGETKVMCSAPNCTRWAHAYNLCDSHYRAHRRRAPLKTLPGKPEINVPGATVSRACYEKLLARGPSVGEAVQAVLEQWAIYSNVRPPRFKAGA